MRRGFLVLGVLAVVVAAIAVVAGSTKLVVGGVVLRNSSVMRPLLVAAAAFALAQAWRHALTWAPVALLLLLPLSAARETLLAASRPAHPLRTLRDCARPLVEAGRVAGGAYAVSADSITHTYAFYTLPLGPWEATTTLEDAHRRMLDDVARPRLLILSGRAVQRPGARAAAAEQDDAAGDQRQSEHRGAPAGPARGLRRRRHPRRGASGRRAVRGHFVTPPIDLSIVIPAYNEAGRIGPTLDRLIAALDPLALPWEILVADDGSSDHTAGHRRRDGGAPSPRVRVLRLPHRGKGATLRDGLLAAAGTRRFLCDADLSMPPAQIGRFLAVLPSQSDIAIGSREGEGAVRIGEPLHRHLLGRVFNTLVRAMVLPGIQDTQCGFKLFTAEAVQAVLPTTAIDGWSFDVELLASARAQGWRIREVPIEWHYGQASRLRVLPHSFEMLRDLFRIRAKIRRGAFARPASGGPPA